MAYGTDNLQVASRSRSGLGREGSGNGELRSTLGSCRWSFLGVGLFSAVINLLMLTGSLYMLQVYDRVLASRSVATLIGLSLIVLAAYLLQGGLEALRAKMLARIGARFDELLAGRVFALVAALPLHGAPPAECLQPPRDLDRIRTFLAGLGPTALFDLPFVPLFLGGCFLIHPWLGWLAVGGGGVIVALTLLTETKSRTPTAALTKSLAERHALLETSRRNAEAVRALGLRAALASRFATVNARHVADGLTLSAATAGLGAAAKTFRMLLQSAALGLGAYLVIHAEMTGGAMIACSILLSRALAPIEVAVAHWKGFVAARQGYRRLAQVLALVPAPAARLSLPAPVASLTVQDVAVGPPGLPRPLVQGVSFTLQAGQALGLIGPSAAGKSTLARALVGVWPCLRGEVRLDGATLAQWEADALGRHLGYLPQDVELFDGTVAANIARFQADAPAEAVVAAAQAAGAHELILQLADGYDTRLGEGGAVLSGGQRQRVALARALFGDPFLVVLDEPNASLDGAGDEALNRAIAAVRRRGGIVVVITHRPAALAQVDLVGVMEAGRLTALGPRDAVLPAVTPRPGGPARAAPLREVG